MMEIIDIAREVLNLEAKELERQANLIGSEFEKAVNLIQNCSGKLIVTGVGKSGHIGAKIAATLASTGTPSFFIHPTEALHGDLGMISIGDIVLAISFSGESNELIAILPHIKKRGIKIIGMSKSGSSLANLSNANLNLDIIREACPFDAAPTVSTTLTLAFGDALAVCLMRLRNFQKEDFAMFHPGGSLGKRLYLKVSDTMRKENLPIVSDEVSLKYAIDSMTHGKLGSVLLTNSKGELVAILSDGDLRRALSSENFDINDKAIKFATKNPKVLEDENTLAYDALKLIEEYKIQILIITKDKKPIGALHIHDLTSLGL
ncbi:KpsF/GutQ family sugar-phosphate isomerase [Campylobacter hyointestinalis subsp. lawsonii]|uniref:KpsF/GutQ family sugar-phosphate isomerase n=3 Tax=Campylobacter hyointestinalis TaxID=198 RepID=A0AAV6EJ02_CAMHY|nr:KpsF/GutQ family sugar-phosphate isomerase [Campylobacter hyointestinalis]KAB0613809.1 KpsF/GutQ family sugar-phosphate isomerase [Campylobacter hyointestinalis subsp. lawsonii]RAZ24541.1 KpsF/GutQ family sugar-phosphate isomerase [Campylobacter hyointestinalis subsp. lawsonii]RAZ29289.1 KpsF/GutQ family sugar-phosphate isomerase [Campylobacter hyointestinalis subsp. lawsonii]RAZ39164.1 KpsF/GutQ family sugar-phosphate isomerase [Campylobacter hyointestinalis subsp. lawsonii]RAZ51679.1 KpsF